MSGVSDLTEPDPSDSLPFATQSRPYPMGQNPSDSLPFATQSRPSTGRAARSFIPRTGRMSSTKQLALTDILPRYLIAPGVRTDFEALFGRAAPLMMDIGFGMGESTLALATARPEVNVIAIDVHVAGHATLANRLAKTGIDNVRIVAADAHEVLLWMCDPSSLHEVHIWFSDPWPKQRQAWRRLVQPDFVALVAERLEIGGTLRMATDWQPYALEMLNAIENTPLLRNPYPSWAPRDQVRPITSYERKGIDAQRPIRDLVAHRCQS
jgi:tRNA (guanine-N7-)-methyltransferase